MWRKEIEKQKNTLNEKRNELMMLSFPAWQIIKAFLGKPSTFEEHIKYLGLFGATEKEVQRKHSPQPRPETLRNTESADEIIARALKVVEIDQKHQKRVLDKK